jgi:hypothetical protein
MCSEIPSGLTVDSTALGRRSLPKADTSAALTGPAFRRMRKARNAQEEPAVKHKRHGFSHDLASSFA